MSLSDPPNAERQRQTRARVAAQDYRHGVCRELERLAPLRRYYGSRPLLAVPLGQIYVRGPWAA